MKSLEQHNEDRRRALDNIKLPRARGPQPNGIACPECGHELVDPYPEATLMSNPPQKSVSCPQCPFTGYRLA